MDDESDDWRSYRVDDLPQPAENVPPIEDSPSRPASLPSDSIGVRSIDVTKPLQWEELMAAMSG